MGLGYQPEEIVLVDDSKEKVVRQPRSHLQVSPFEGDRADRELLRVREWLNERWHEAGGERAV